MIHSSTVKPCNVREVLCMTCVFLQFVTLGREYLTVLSEDMVDCENFYSVDYLQIFEVKHVRDIDRGPIAYLRKAVSEVTAQGMTRLK